MKKLTAILLLALFLFNLVGYRLWFNYAQQQADQKLEASLDKNQYNDAELITIRIPLSMPYQTVQSGFERVDGEININGKIYKYVKRRIDNGVLVIMCLPDHNKMHIQSAKDDYFKNTADLSQNNNSKKSGNSQTNSFKNLVSDYDQHIISYNIAHFSATVSHSALLLSLRLPSSPHTPPVQPPDFA